MARGRPGADSISIVTQELVDGAAQFFEEVPAFWGRYFKGPNDTGAGQYQARRESPVLRRNGIPVLPIGRQTRRVGGSRAEGEQDGRSNAQAVLTAFGADYLATLDNQPFVFLDVEQDTPLSTEYFLGWSDGLMDEGRAGSGGRVEFTPAIYSSQGARPTWEALRRAVAQGAVCGAAWIARYVVADGCASMPNWSDSRVAPAGGLPAGCAAVAWQYAQNCHRIDLNQVNPAAEADFLRRLILPPETVEMEAAVAMAGAVAEADFDTRDIAEQFRATLAASVQRLTEASQTQAGEKPYFFPEGIFHVELELSLNKPSQPGLYVKLTVSGRKS
jgi:hypothetical protein